MKSHCIVGVVVPTKLSPGTGETMLNEPVGRRIRDAYSESFGRVSSMSGFSLAISVIS